MARLSNGPTGHYRPKFPFPHNLKGKLPIKQEIYMPAGFGFAPRQFLTHAALASIVAGKFFLEVVL